MKSVTSISVDSKVLKLVKASGVNVSQICEDALKEAVDFTDSEAIASKIDRLKRELVLLGEQMVNIDSQDSSLQRVQLLYDSRHRSNPNTTEEQDLFWLKAIKHQYELTEIPAEKILEELKHGSKQENDSDQV